MKKTQTRRALLMSVLSLLLCCSMLIGTTFAWFTDTVESGINKITAGNLDIELEYYDSVAKEWKTVNKTENLFSGELWEPGHTEVVYLRLKNLGTLALKYQLAINIDETPGINVDDKVFKLSDYIYMGIQEGVNGENGAFATREAAIEAVNEAGEDPAAVISTGYAKSGHMEKGTADLYLAVVVYMPTTVGNEANYKTGTNAPVINLGINLIATQYTMEQDSFGKDYDKDAAWTGGVDTAWYNTTDTEFTLTTAEQLAGLAQIVNAGTDSFINKTVKLGANIDLNNVNWTPIGQGANRFEGTFIGTGYTISNLRAVGEKTVGLFGKTFTGAHIEGVTIDTAYVSGNDYVGAILGQGYLGHNCIVNCTVTNATIIAIPYKLADGTYDGGAKAGVIAGQAYNGNITGCVVKESTVTAYRDLGGIAGMHDFDGTGNVVASGNTVENVALSYVAVSGKYDGNKPNQNMNDVVGRKGTNATIGTNTVTNVSKDEKAVAIFTLEELIAFANAVNAGNTYAGKTVILGDNIDLANMEWTPIGTAEGGFKGIFDGNGKIISNLKITGNKSTVGLFANTYDGEIKNLTVENAKVSGRLNVGVVAGNPYTSKYTNITVQGHVEVNGMAYVGGVGGKNAYANWTNIKVDVNEGSYVKAISTENGSAYRTYVGGVVGFNGEGGHTFKNIASNIDVIGDVCDIGGVFGIAHYGNNFENITCAGNVTNLISAENDGDDAATDVLETGLIAGVWHNENGTTVSFTNISATGEIFTPNVNPAGEFAYGGLVGKAYSASGTGKLIIKNYFEINGLTCYKNGVTNDIVLSAIPQNAPATVVVPEGVTVLGSKILQGNTTVKEVVIPSSVMDFGGTPNATGTGASGGMFYQSAVEKVVLPEGLEEIPAAMFNQASKLTSVNIPDSVKKIGINAFAGSGLTSLTISENVEEIGYGAFRDMDNLTTITIEGDVYIPDYAFRDCSVLKDVYLKGENVTFGSGMIFTVTSTNNEKPNGITVHVANPVVKARLEASGQFKGVIDCPVNADSETGLWTDANGNDCAYVADANEMSSAITNGADKVYLPNGNFVIPTAAQGKTLTIVGSGDTNVGTNAATGAYEGCNYALDGSTVVFENVVINTDSGTYTGYARCNATFNNCTINGMLTLYGDMVFNNCTFNISGDNYNIKTWGAPTAEFNNCTFNSDGKAMLLYGGANTKLTLNDCTFNDNGGLADKKAAVEIGNDYGTSYELIVNNTVVNGYEINDKGINTGSTLWGNKNSMGTDKLNVVVDGIDVY